MWTLTPDELQLTRAKIEKINSRAQKKGFTGRLSLTVEPTELVRSIAGIKIVENVFNVNIAGEPPRYGNWTFLASLDWVENGVIVRTAPGVENIDRSNLSKYKCDHCNVQRARRKAYVVSDGKRQLQVGSSCLKDFLGWSASPVFISNEEVNEEISGFAGLGGARSFSVESVLAIAWACVTTYGYVRTSDIGISTRQKVMDVLDPYNKYSRELAEEIKPIAKDAEPMAKKLREFILSDEFNSDTEYVHNLKTLCAGDSITHQHLGLLASVPQAYARHQERTFIKQREKSEILNEWVGKEKERLTLSVRITAVRFIDNDYGVTTLYTMLSRTGHVFKWFSTNGKFGEKTTEEFFDIVGTVKNHNEYNGFKSTILTRCNKK